MTYIDVPHILRTTSRVEAEAVFESNSRSAYLGGNRALCIVLGKYKMYVDTTDIGFSPHMMFDGYWEYWLTKFIADHVAEGAHVMDVGANLGYYTLLLADIVGESGKVYGFEPNPVLFEMLRSTVRLNGFWRQASLVNAALIDDPQQVEVPFFVPRNEPKNGTIVQAGYSDPRGCVISAPARTVGSLDIRRLDFIKIDVEGAEKALLESLQPIKQELTPKIVVEVNFGRNYSYDDIVRLAGYGSELLHIDFDGDIKPLTRKLVSEERQDEDWLVYWPGTEPSIASG